MPIPKNLTAAVALHQQGNLAEAAALYQEVLAAEPENADAWHLMGVAAHQQGKNDLAATLIQNAINLKDDVADFHSNLGRVHHSLSLDDRADQDYRRALEIAPNHVKALSNLAGLLRRTGQFSAAVDYAQRAVTAGPQDPEAHNNLGNTLKDVGEYEDAIASYRRAIELTPDYALAHWNLALALLSLGHYAEGFREMDWRWQWPGFPAKARAFESPHLAALGNPAGKRVLLHAEQGLGDTIHFIRYGARLRQAGAHVIFECPSPLLPLMAAGQTLVDEIVPVGAALPAFDAHAALLDMPLWCQTNIAADTKTGTAPILAEIPYLIVPEEIAEKWRQRISSAAGLKVGLNWCGNPASPVEIFRALPTHELTPLAALTGVTWYSLQKGADSAAVPALPAALAVIDTGPEALVETAGLIQALDLVITSDTAVAHLAGALGKEVWLLLHHAPDWRWGTAGPTTPWYPTLRLFRQEQPGQWSRVIAAVQSILEARLK